MTPLNDRPGLQIMTSPCAPPIFDDHLGSPSSPTNTAQLATSPYKSTFSSFFRSMASSDTLHDDQPISAVLLPPPLTAVASSADALIQLESCLDALKRPHQTNDVPVAGSMTSEMFSESSMSPGISSNGHAVTSGLSTGAELHTDSSQVSALMAATGEESAIGMELANACGWIFTGLVLEVVSLATESRRVAEGIGKNGQANAEEQVYNTTTHAQGHTNGEREQADLPCFRKDKGKQKEEHAATSTDGQQGSRRRRRFSLSFNIKEILNLDDIEERLNENPKNVPDDPCHWKADWDTLCELLKHLVEIYRHEDYKETEGAYVYRVPLDLVLSHNPALTGSLPIITPIPAIPEPSSQTSSPVDRFSCDNGESCRDVHVHSYDSRRTSVILCGRLKTLIEQREEIRLYGHMSSHELDTLDPETRDMVIWVKACLACCLYLLARSESPSQLYLLQLLELLPTGISHIDYLVNDIASTFTQRSKRSHPQDTTCKSKQRSRRDSTDILSPTPLTESQHSTLRERRCTLSAKPSSIFSFSSSIFSVGGRFNRPVKSSTSLPQLSLDSVGSNMGANPGMSSSASFAGLPSAGSVLRAEGSRGSAMCILQKYQRASPSKATLSGSAQPKAYGTWSRLSNIRPFRQSPLSSTDSLPSVAKPCEPINRNGSSQNMTSGHSVVTYPQVISSTPIKTVSPPRLSDSITSQETTESHGLEIPVIKTIASTPSPRAASMFPRTPPNDFGDQLLNPRIRGKPRAFENTLALPPLDSAFAAAEKASVLTKKDHCAICGKEGYNFPACRKCNHHFCSRACRIGQNKGGDGKKHVCAKPAAKPNTQSSQFLTLPGAATRVKNVG